jgi:hypothetical protein
MVAVSIAADSASQASGGANSAGARYRGKDSQGKN